MPFFYFNPNNYGEEAFVSAPSIEEAKAALLATKGQHHVDVATLDMMLNCQHGYTIDEVEDGVVIFSEIA